MNENGTPIPPEGSQAYADRAARQEAADAAYARAQAAQTAPLNSDAANQAATDPAQAAQTAPLNNGAGYQPAQTAPMGAAYNAQTGQRYNTQTGEPYNAYTGAAQTAPQQPVQNTTAAPKASKPAKQGGAGKAFLAGAGGALVVVIIAALLFAFTPLKSALLGSGSTDSSVTGGTYNITASEDATVSEAVAAKCLPSVVTLYVYEASSDWSQFFNGGSSSSSSSSSPSALGSGEIIQSDDDTSYVLTNYHVIEDSSRVTIEYDGTTYDATVVGTDDNVDLAVVSIPVGNLPVIEWGDSSSLVVGEWCMAIGSPMGYEDTCTTGIISATGRSDSISDGSTTYYQSNVIQTDASINPGNSGGALVDSEGKLIGVVEYLSSYSSSSAGLGFAIPQSTAQEVAEQLIAGETPSHPMLGVQMQDASDGGAVIAAVVKDSGADKAGLQAGDIITKIDSTTISSSSAVTSYIASCNVGDEIEITYTRDGSEQTTKATLGKDTDASSEYSSQLDNSSSQGNSQGYGYGNEGYGYGYGNEGYGYGNQGYGDSNSNGSNGYNIYDIFQQMFGQQ